MALTHDKIVVSGNVYEHLRFPQPIYYKSATEREAEKAQSLLLSDLRSRFSYGVQGQLIRKSTPFMARVQQKVALGSMRHISQGRARVRLRRLINSNAGFWLKKNKSAYPVMFLTLTFREEITDLKTANYEFTKWIKRLSYELYGTHTNKLKYVAVPEIQKGREQLYGFAVWHFHVLVFNMPYHTRAINVITDTWGQGYVFAKTVFDVNKAGGYLAKYIAKDFADRDYFMKAYYCSRDLFRPIIEYSSRKCRDIICCFDKMKKLVDRYFDTPQQQNVHYCLFVRGSL